MAKKILVVDDEKDFCSLFRENLKRHDCSCDIAYDGLEAKDLLEKNKYDFIFFDCNMPGLTGVELVRIIKEKNPEARKIMISGYDLIEEGFAKDLGVDLFLNKPILFEQIEKIIKENL